MTSFQLRESTLALEGPLQASKLLKLAVLFDPQELKNCIEDLDKEFGELYFFQVQGIIEKSSLPFDRSLFFHFYEKYIEDLKAGKEPSTSVYSPYLSLIATVDPSAVYLMSLDEKRCLIKASRPVIQIQMHYVHYSQENSEFHSMVYSKESIAWGLHLTYPQLFQDNRTHEIFHVKEGPQFPNTSVFKSLMRWVRHRTSPTTFILGNKVSSEPIRIGKECKKWIECHAKLKQYGIHVK